MKSLCYSVCSLLFITPVAFADDPPTEMPGDRMLAEYFLAETRLLTEQTFAGIETLADWEAVRETYRQQLLEMLGLDPLPERTPLNAVVTGGVEHDEFTVENIHFQSRPGLYVTGNLYVPKERDGPMPAVLYVCGHARATDDNGVRSGNKTAYHHHGAWFARNGYVCLTIDTLQLGEIEGIHHGTYNHDMWWWNSRGYCPAGVEAWNCVRALDYLQERPEVDGARLGVTGRSGGGAYSWWIAAIDDRIGCAVPVAGITSLQNHVVDGCVEGHCDCMYMINTYRWDFPTVAALVAPRPLLISNTDKDRIFPLDGVVDVYMKTKKIYELYDATDRLGLQITEGPHKDTQELRVHAFVWMNRFLKEDDSLIEEPAVKFFEREQLKVFDELPADEQNSTIHESFVAEADNAVPQSEGTWTQMRDDWRTKLKDRCFRGWPDEGESWDLDVQNTGRFENDGVRLSVYSFTSQSPFELNLYVAAPADRPINELDLVVLNVLDDQGWSDFVGLMKAGFEQPFAAFEGESAPERWRETAQMFANQPWGMAWVAPRGIGSTEWNRDERKRTQIRRRFMLLGQTLDGMRVWDTRRAAQALRTVQGFRDVPLWLQGERNAAAWALYASLFEPDIARLDLWSLPHSHREGPTFLNVQRYLDIPQAVALAGERSRVRVYDADASAWRYPLAVAEQLGWPAHQVKVRPVPAASE